MEVFLNHKLLLFYSCSKMSKHTFLEKFPSVKSTESIVTDWFSPFSCRAQLSEIYSNGQEKILQMQEIRSDVHSRLYVFLK